MNVQTYEDPEALARAAARAFVEEAGNSIAERGRFAVALAGGSTPKATYEVLARDHAEDVDWPNVHVFFGDERTVSPDHEDSNFRMARETLLDHVPIGSVHRMHGELPPDEAAGAYGRTLEEFFGGTTPVLDLVMLGIGGDGHTASLFPGTPALEVTDRFAFANPVPKLETVRITLTAPVLSAARRVLFLVAGQSKADALREILERDADPREYPARLVRPTDGPTWMLDRAAASRIKES